MRGKRASLIRRLSRFSVRICSSISVNAIGKSTVLEALDVFFVVNFDIDNQGNDYFIESEVIASIQQNRDLIISAFMKWTHRGSSPSALPTTLKPFVEPDSMLSSARNATEPNSIVVTTLNQYAISNTSTISCGARRTKFPTVPLGIN